MTLHKLDGPPVLSARRAAAEALGDKIPFRHNGVEMAREQIVINMANFYPNTFLTTE